MLAATAFYCFQAGASLCEGTDYCRLSLLEEVFCLGKASPGYCERRGFGSLASVSSASDLHPTILKHHPSLFLIVHTDESFDTALEQIEICRSRYPNGRIAVVVDRYRLNDLISAFRTGANGYFVNVVSRDRFVKSSSS